MKREFLQFVFKDLIYRQANSLWNRFPVQNVFLVKKLTDDAKREAFFQLCRKYFEEV